MGIVLIFTQGVAFGSVKCDLLQDTELKYHCKKMEQIQKKIKGLEYPESAANLSFLLFDKDVKMLNETEFNALKNKAAEADHTEFEQRKKVLEQKRLLYFKEFLLRKRQITEENKITAQKNSLYGLIQEDEIQPVKPVKQKAKRVKYTYDPKYGWVETLVW